LFHMARELAWIAELMSSGRAPLVAIVGPSGSGKTTFLKHLFQQITIRKIFLHPAARAADYSGLPSGALQIGGDCLYKYRYEAVALLRTEMKGLTALADAVACGLLREAGLEAAAQLCKDARVNSSALEWARTELRPMLRWLGPQCHVVDGAVPYEHHVDVIAMLLLRCCVKSRFAGFIDDVQLLPRLDASYFVKLMRDTASIAIGVHPDPLVEREVAAMAASAYVLCLTPREFWSEPQIRYWKQLYHRLTGSYFEPRSGAYACKVLQREVKVRLE